MQGSKLQNIDFLLLCQDVKSNKLILQNRLIIMILQQSNTPGKVQQYLFLEKQVPFSIG